MKIRKRNRLVQGIGVNDADYITEKRVNKKTIWFCPFYQKWKDMLKRCYSENYQRKYSTYKGCTVCNEWLTFSNFKAWMETQDWQGNQLDKDILFEGNKLYSPETCVFVDSSVNSFLLDCAARRGEYPIGVHWDKRINKYVAQVRVNNKRKHLGCFNDPNDAYLTWLKAKQEALLILIEDVEDQRIVDALLKRYRQDDVLTK